MKVNYPTSWQDVTIKQYYDLLEVINIEANDEDKALMMLGALTGIPIEDLQSKVPISELKKAIDALQFIGGKTDYKPKVVLRLGKRKFEFDMILKESNAASFISLSDYCKDAETTKKNIHNIIAVFTHELGWFGRRKARTIHSQKEMAEYFLNNLTMDKAFGYSAFFLTSYKALLKSTADYLKRKQMKIARELMKVANQTL